jgi:sigma-B regulation protein RsbU (phosphoserine phosphatase)
VDTLILRADGTVVPLSSTGTPLGLLPLAFPFGETPLVLHRGDMLVLFSDGVPEAINLADEEYGEARLVDVLRACASLPASEVIDRVLAAIDAFVGEAPQFDDITLLVVKRACGS